MSDPGSTRDKSSSQSRMPLWILLGGLTAGIAAFAIWKFGGDSGMSRGVSEASQQQLELTRTALAATENLEMVQADESWSLLYGQLADDPSVALNRAINRVLRVDELSSKATNASLDDAQKQDARKQLPDAISAAREAVEDYAKVTENAVMPIWLDARVDLHEASLLPGSMTKSLRKEIYSRLSEAVRGDPGKASDGRILGGSLIQVVEQLEDPIDGLPRDLLADAAKTVGTLSDEHPENLFFALRAARLSIETQDQLAAKFVERANSLARAIEPSLRRETQPIGVTPDELVAQIVTAIKSKDWSEAENRMLLWFNVLNSTEIVKTDRRRASPHPLDLLSFDALRRLSAEVVEGAPLDVATAEFQFDSKRIDQNGTPQTLLTLDFDLDLDRDLICATDDGTLQLWINDGEGGFEPGGQVALGFKINGLVSADLFLVDSSNPKRLRAGRKSTGDGEPDFGAAVRHDTFQSVLAFGAEGAKLIQIDGRTETEATARMTLVEGTTGLEDVGAVTAAVSGDLEADGDLDLILATESEGVRLFANRGNRSFFEIGQAASTFSDDPVSAMTIVDLDRDLDLDVVTVHRGSGKVGLIENLLHLQFRGRYLDEIPPTEDASFVTVEDIDGNVSWDLVVAGAGGVKVAFSQTADANAWKVERVEQSDQPLESAVVADFDNDSWMDVLGVAGKEVRVSRLGPWGIGEWGSVSSLSNAAALVPADFNVNGAIDLAGLKTGAVEVMLNRTEPMGHFVDVRFKGIDDNASGRVNHYAVGSVLEIRFGPHYRARIVRSPSTHFGLDGFDVASTVRAILPNGLTQTIRDPKVDSLVEEEQTLKGSCPYLYAWDGEKYVFQTDCLWAAPLGLQVARGVVAKDRPWEYLKIEGDRIRPRGDRYDFRITEELWEVAYFDKIALTVVDHPSDVEIWTNEKVGPGQIAEPTIFAFGNQHRLPLVGGSDTYERDVTEKLRQVDRDFVQGFDRRLRQGLCEPHWIDLDFGDAEKFKAVADEKDDQEARVYLVLTGWILPTDTSLNIQIDQNPSLGPLEFPSVWVPDSNADSGWSQAIEYMGFPGGKTKTIVVDVTEVMNRADPRFRIRTSAQIYWDCAEIAIQKSPAEFRTEDVALLNAEVAFHGFSERRRDDLTHPETYDYQNSDAAARWPPLRGGLTRFGECTDLVREWDDAMVVIGSGDEVRLEFSTPESQLPPGWKRDFIFHSVGWDKDADLNTLSGQSTMPLPYRGMTQYPPAANAGSKRDQLRKVNQTHLQRTQSFRSFWYRAEPSGTTRFGDVSMTVEE
ncbi:MAG: CRTAC1 family protein [Rubripirellula sp.]